MDRIVEKIIYLKGLAAKTKKSKAKGINKFVNSLVQKSLIKDIEFPIIKSEKPTIDNFYLFSNKKFVAWKVGLATLVARHFSCSILEDHSLEEKVYHYKLAGRNKDIINAKKLFNALLNEINNESKRFMDQLHKQSYCEGMVSAIRLSLTNIKQSVKADAINNGNSMNLFYFNERAKNSSSFSEKNKFTKLAKVHTSKIIDSKYFECGVNDGYLLFGLSSIDKLSRDILL